MEIEKWRDEKIVEQEALPLSEMPKLTVSMINSKVRKKVCYLFSNYQSG